MSKEQAIRFMLHIERDEELKRKYQDIKNKYEEKNLTKEEQEKIIMEEVIPLAKSMNFDFCTGDFQELLQPEKQQLNDEELDEVVGGSGQFISGNLKYSCEKIHNNEEFRRFAMAERNYCPFFEFGNQPWVTRTVGKNHCNNCLYFKYEGV